MIYVYNELVPKFASSSVVIFELFVGLCFRRLLESLPLKEM